MVTFIPLRSLKPVLYSLKDRTWKITDFGLTMPGTSSVARTTVYARGTVGYRAPELLTENTSRYTNRLDIFSVGCIFFELSFCCKAFRDDFAIRQYAINGEILPMPATSDVIPDEGRKEIITDLIRQMIDIDPSKRPRASKLFSIFALGATHQPPKPESTESPGTITTPAAAAS